MSAYFKTILRSVRQSFARFAAIFAIIALGVGFFSGLKLTMPSFIKTGDLYVNETKLFDFRLLSTVGFNDDDIAELSTTEGVESVRGAVSADLMVQIDGNPNNTDTVKMHSLTDGINVPKLIKGRMPQAPNEVLADDYQLNDDDSFLGVRLVVSPDNNKDTKDLLVYDEYVIVGLVRSPYYLNFQRGNTDVGSGSIQYFLYADEKAFDFEYYSEVFVKYASEYEIFSDAYDEFADKAQKVLESRVEDVIGTRFDDMVADARKELDEAKEEFETKKADGEKELADAKAELADAEKELADGKDKLDEADKELKDARKTLDDSAAQLRDAKKELDSARKKIDDGKKELEAGQKEVDANRAELNKAKEELNANLEKVNDGISQTKAAISDLEQKLDGLNATIASLEETRQQLIDAKEAGADVDAELAEVEAGLAQARQGKEQVEAGLGQAQSTLAELNANLAAINAGLEEVKKNEALIDEAQKKIDSSAEELANAEKQYKDGLDKYNKGMSEYKKGESKYSDGVKEYNENLDKYNEGVDEYNDGLKEYEDGLAEFDQKIAEAQEEIDDAEKKLGDLENPETYVLGRDTNVGYMSFDNDSQIVDGIAQVFPVFFFAIAALVCSTTMSRMVGDERTQIGTMRALGYSEFAIMMKYIIYSGTAAVSGCIVGFLAGTKVFPYVIWQVYGMMYGFADISYETSVWVFLLSLFVSVLCSVGVTVATCLSEFRGMPSELIRPKAPTAGKRILLERITPVWSHFKFLHKVSFRNVFRFKKRMLMMLIGIAGCTGLLITGFGLTDSINDIVDIHYDNVMTYDLSVVFNKMNVEDIRKEAEGRCDMVPVEIKSVTHQGNDLLRDVSLIVSDDSRITDFVRPHKYGSGEDMPWPEKGTVAISSKLANKNGLKAGDMITLSYNDGASRMNVKIAYVFENYIFHYALMSGETYTDLTREKFVPDQALFRNFAEGELATKLAVDLTDKYDVKTWNVTSSMRESFSETVKQMNAVVLLIIACAAFLAFIVMFNLNNINITERIREIATLKVMGFNRLETGSYVFRENIILVLMGYVFGIPLGLALHAFVIAQIEMDTVTFVPRVLPLSYVWSAGFVVLFTITVDLIMRAKIEKINMAESLKSVE